MLDSAAWHVASVHPAMDAALASLADEANSIETSTVKIYVYDPALPGVEISPTIGSFGDVLNLTVRNSLGGMVPLSAFATVDWIRGPLQIRPDHPRGPAEGTQVAARFTMHSRDRRGAQHAFWS